MEQQQPFQPQPIRPQPMQQPPQQYGQYAVGPPQYQGPCQPLLPPSTSCRPSRHSCAVKALAILQVLLGALASQIGVGILVVKSALYYTGASVWGAVLFYIPAGILGAISVTTTVPARRKGYAIACMVMSILAACASGANIALSSASISVDIRISDTVAAIALNSCNLFLSLFELVVAIVAAAYCCLVTGELHTANNTNIQYVPTYIPGGGMGQPPAYHNYGAPVSQTTTPTPSAPTPMPTPENEKVGLA
ncbi:uncharacterized protein LOC119728105 [Patiria miniata]|uniref:Uncharacterized protein n=1 Tax=Patiria miniata TaxID=46514 RepID=A0A913ZYG1_PATMI|nr:uncharacterized protein LOC119728105 [Patiria miniata]